MKRFLLLIVFFITAFIFGCNKPKTEPEISTFSPNEKFTVVAIEDIPDLKMKSAKVKKESDGSVFRVLVPEEKKFAIGQVVRLWRVEYDHNFSSKDIDTRTRFLIIRDVVGE